MALVWLEILGKSTEASTTRRGFRFVGKHGRVRGNDVTHTTYINIGLYSQTSNIKLFYAI